MYPASQLLAILGNTPILRHHQYEQIKGLINFIRQECNIFRPLTKFEMCLEGVRGRKKILSGLYDILLSSFSVIDTVKYKWERDLDVNLPGTQSRKIRQFNQTFSVNIDIRENRFKLLNIWHFSPLKLGRMYPSVGDACWKCGYDGADFFLMWWDCPSVFSLWSAVGNVLSQIIGKQIPQNPRLMLLLDMDHLHLENHRMFLAY